MTYSSILDQLKNTLDKSELCPPLERRRGNSQVSQFRVFDQNLGYMGPMISPVCLEVAEKNMRAG